MTISSLIAPAVGTIIGSCIGAGVSYFVARKTAREAKAERDRVEKENEKLATYRVGTALFTLANAAAGYHLNSERQITAEEHKYIGTNYQLWQIMKALSGSSADISIAPGDMIALWKAKQFDYISRILFTIEEYNSMRAMVEEYRKSRDALFAKLSPAKMDGLLGTIHLTEAQQRQLAPEIAVVQDHAEHTRQYMRVVNDHARAIVKEFGPIIRFYFDDPSFPVPSINN